MSEKPVKKEWNVPHEKKKVLSEKYNIAMTAELESEVQRMCNLGTAIVQE